MLEIGWRMQTFRCLNEKITNLEIYHRFCFPYVSAHPPAPIPQILKS